MHNFIKPGLLLLLSFIFTFQLYAQDISGKWKGVLNVQNTQLRLVFNISKTTEGYTATMDSPDQGANGIPVTSARFDAPVLKLSVAQAGIEYEGTLTGNNTIIGNFKQSGHVFPMELTRATDEKKTAAAKKEVKNEKYGENPVALETKSGKIYGTITTPRKFKSGPLVLIIAGSGPTDRNCNNPMMTCDAYKKLAHELAANNIASIRYDKRGIGESKAAVKSEKDLRFEDYVNDAKDWIKLAKKDKRFTEIIVLGHSEGALIGSMAAADANKFISVAGAGQPAAVLIKEQLAQQPQEVQDAALPVLEKIARGETVDNVPPMLAALFRKDVQSYMISWFGYNPQTEIKKLTIPALIIQGTNDLQVAEKDAELLAQANPKARLLLIKNMNHIFRTVEGDRQANIASYNNAALPLADDFVKGVVGFVREK